MKKIPTLWTERKRNRRLLGVNKWGGGGRRDAGYVPLPGVGIDPSPGLLG